MELPPERITPERITPERITPERITIESLKELIGQRQAGGLPREGAKRGAKGLLVSSDLPAGLPLGALIEVVGSARTEWLAAVLAQNPKQKIAWVEDVLSVNPSALQQRGVDLRRVLFIHAKNELEWTINTLLRSKLFALVISPGNFRAGVKTERQMRRFQILAKDAGTSLVFLSEKPTSHWTVMVQVEAKRVRGSDRLKVQLLKSKGLPSSTGHA